MDIVSDLTEFEGDTDKQISNFSEFVKFCNAVIVNRCAVARWCVARGILICHKNLKNLQY